MGQQKAVVPGKGAGAVAKPSGEIPIYNNEQLNALSSNKDAQGGGATAGSIAQAAKDELARRSANAPTVTVPGTPVASNATADAAIATRPRVLADEQTPGVIEKKEDKTGITRGSTGPLSA